MFRGHPRSTPGAALLPFLPLLPATSGNKGWWTLMNTLREAESLAKRFTTGFPAWCWTLPEAVA
jgi:hypothetical protein